MASNSKKPTYTAEDEIRVLERLGLSDKKLMSTEQSRQQSNQISSKVTATPAKSSKTAAAPKPAKPSYSAEDEKRVLERLGLSCQKTNDEYAQEVNKDLKVFKDHLKSVKVGLRYATVHC